MIILQTRDAKIYKLLIVAKNYSTISRLAANRHFMFSYGFSVFVQVEFGDIFVDKKVHHVAINVHQNKKNGL